MQELRWRSVGVACLLTGGLGAIIGVVETLIADRDIPAGFGDILYGVDIHLLLAAGVCLLLRVLAFKLPARSFPTFALGAFMAVELGLVGAYWLTSAAFMPPLHTLAGRIAMLIAALSGILISGLLTRRLARRMSHAAYMTAAQGVGGRLGLALLVLILLANGIALGKVLHRPGHPMPRSVPGIDRLPDVYVILVDTLRQDHLSCFGYDRPTTPNIDRLFSESWVFTDAYNPSTWTTPSIASIFTGFYPNTHRVLSAMQVVPDEAPTLAEHFRSYGYRTGAFVANGTITTSNGFGQGFATFFPPGPPRWSRAQRTAVERIVTRARRPGNASRGWRINLEAVNWVREQGDQPLFAYVHYMEPHAPYEPPPSDRETVAPGAPPGPKDPPNFVHHQRATGADLECRDWECLSNPPEIPANSLAGMIANYDGEILLVDRRVGELIERLDALGALDNAHLIFCSDHGEEFADHGGWAHVNSIYEEIAACPLAYRPPGGLPGGRELARPVALLDLLRTLCELVGIEGPPMHQGRIIPELLGERAPQADQPVVCAMPPNLFSLRLRQWKLLRRGKSSDPVWRLFDLDVDPGERDDLAAVRPDTLAFLRGYLEGIIADQSRSALTEIITNADPELLRQLKNLGYVR